jgi:LysM repeat protein
MRRNMIVALVLCVLMGGCAAKATPTPTPEPTTAPRPGITSDSELFATRPTPTAPEPTPTRTPTLVPKPTSIIYVVQAGDVLGVIAQAYGTTVKAIMEANGLTDADFIREGQELVIPPPGPTPVSVAPTATP